MISDATADVAQGPLSGPAALGHLYQRPAAADLDYALRTSVAEEVNASKEEKPAMKCTIAGCPGICGLRIVVHTVKQHGQALVIDHVPAEVCNVCGHVHLAPETVRRIEALVEATLPPIRNITFYERA